MDWLPMWKGRYAGFGTGGGIDGHADVLREPVRTRIGSEVAVEGVILLQEDHEMMDGRDRLVCETGRDGGAAWAASRGERASEHGRGRSRHRGGASWPHLVDHDDGTLNRAVWVC